MTVLLVGTALVALSPTAAAHPVQLDCTKPIGYTAIGPDLSGDPTEWWIATLGCGLDYPSICLYDPNYEPDCSDDRHIGVPFCKSCFDP